MTDEERIELLRLLEARERATPSAELLSGRDSLAEYARHHWPGFELAPHHKILIEHLERVERGEIRRLMIFMPPRHGKSTTSTQYFPAWYLGKHPDRSVISATYGQDLADDFGRKVRDALRSDIHQSIFPESRLIGDSNSIKRFNLSAGGSYYAVGRGGPITGRGAHLFLIDDPLKDAQEAASEVICRNLQEWYSAVAYTRLAPNGAIVLIQTRWAEMDLAGWLLKNHTEEGWVQLTLPAIAEEGDAFRKPGEPLWSRFAQEYPRIKRAVGSYVWNALYQQRPAPPEGSIIKRAWCGQFYKELPQKLDWKAQSWDCTFKDTSSSDFVAGHIWAISGGEFWMLPYRVHDRLDMPATMAAIRGARGLHSDCHEILIEDKANGPAVISMLRREIPGIIAVEPQGGKEARLRAVSPLFEAGNVHLPDPTIAPWIDEVIQQWCSFRGEGSIAHDDDCDAMSQALIRLKERGAGLIGFWRQELDRRKREEEEKKKQKGGTQVVRTTHGPFR